VVITNQTEDISGVVELAKGCPVYEGKGTSSTITRLLNLTFGKATSLILDDGTIVEVTVRHEKVKTPEMLRT
ncbi:MAG: hypothetical protein RSD49_21675, partial [Hafnia sp.]